MATAETMTLPISVPRPDSQSATAQLLRRAWVLHKRSNDRDALHWIATHSETPESILYSLCDDDILRAAIAHRKNLSREMVEFLADGYGVDEAILSLGKLLYTSPEETTADFHEFLNNHIRHDWLLQSLVREVPSTGRKRKALVEGIDQRADRNVLLETMDEYELARKIKSSCNDDELLAAARSNSPRVLLALAANPHTPKDILQQLAEISERASARDIRKTAKHNLGARLQ